MSTLYVVGTPIGNLGDITVRALEILKSVSLIACEDTRVTKRLLGHYEIATPVISYHQHSGATKVDTIIKKLQQGDSVAVVSDAGTPGIADPGGMLVQAAHEAGIKVESVPGPSAIAAALSISGMATDRFLFLGFLPHKKGRQTFIAEVMASEHPVIMYESVHRIQKLLEQFVEAGLQRQIIVCRELTKKFESLYRGTPQELLEKIPESEIKGEFVVIVDKN